MEGIHDMEACGNMNRNSSIDDSDFGHHSSPLEVPRDSIQQESINGYVSDQIEINKQASPLMMANNGLNIIGFLKGKNILITGATGFLAKVLVEKILRVQPDVGKLFLLIKAKDAKHVRERLQNEIVQKSLFEYLQQLLGPGYQDFINRKLIPVVGDLSKDNLGMDIDTLSEIQEKVEIIVNSAASTTFDERYDYAINLNTKGAQRILEFGHSCAHLQLLIHVSTAFVNGQRRGRVMEKPFQIGCSITNEAMNAQTDQLVPDIDMNHELQLIRGKKKEIIEEIESASTCAPTSLELLKLKKRLHQEMKDLGMQRAKIFGWQDTYVFTKAMGEMVVDSTRGQVPVVIIRPSVVESSFKDPFPGWMEGNRMMDPVLILYGKGHLPGFLVDPESVLDVVPVDMVANAMLAAMAKHAKEPGIEVYQVASSVVNPLVFFELARMSKEHFTANPFMDNLGKPLPIPKLELFKDMESFLDAVKISTDSIKEPMSCLTDSKDAIRRHKQLTQKVKEQVAYLASLYQPYTFYRGRYDFYFRTSFGIFLLRCK
ncbi:hypothetical protein KP509_13G009800 [Ceratopteris richardii]|uniref:Fatty acyl-CoA reductase n=1 Tax=Ceratopteris richardii TaxID=49495 RepID=A0A8T2TBA4_CERRI|nr:hypothetical protein KP509_13G009800 [Ceratopteris richardii]